MVKISFLFTLLHLFAALFAKKVTTTNPGLTAVYDWFEHLSLTNLDLTAWLQVFLEPKLLVHKWILLTFLSQPGSPQYDRKSLLF